MSKARTGEPLTEEAYRTIYEFEPAPKPKFREILKEECRCSKNTILQLFPIAKWLPKYKIKENLVGDIIGGVTVAVMHIPHGLAYSQLGGVPPVIGLYMAVFPLIIYVTMGMSKHISIGTFAVVCAMVGEILLSIQAENTPEEAIRIASCICFAVGLWQMFLALLRLSSLTIYMSSALVSGFTTGAACHVFTYQFDNLLGIKTNRFSGPLKLVYIYIDLFKHIGETNIVTMSISICFIIFLIAFYYGIKPRIQKKIPKCRLPIPIELIAVALGIIISYFLDLEDKYNVRIVGTVPTGLPFPELPNASILSQVILPSFPVAVVALSINLSLAKIFAEKDAYEISSKQEILAYGVSNVFSSFFQCLPTAASLSRSIIQYGSGGKTQLASLFSLTIIVLILLFMGPVFEPVPYCVLSSIVLVTIFGIILKARELPKIFRLSYLDGTVWLCTFLGVVLVDIDVGLFVGFIASIGSLLFLNHWPQIIRLGPVSDPDLGLYLDVKNFKAASEMPNLMIVQIIGGLNFSNAPHIHTRILRKVDEVELNSKEKYQAALILDFSGLSYVDPTASNFLIHLSKGVDRKGFRMFLAGCNIKVYSDLERARFFDRFEKNLVFATVSDAVMYATKFDVIVAPNNRQ